MKNIIYIFITLIFSSTFAVAQNLGIGTQSPDPSAKLDVTSTDKGMLVPRLTTEKREAISNPANGLLVFDTDRNNFWFYQSSEWIEILQTAGASAPPSLSNAGSLSIGSNPWRMKIQGNYAYIVDYASDDLKIIDLNTLTLLGNYVIGNDPYSVDVQGDFAYVIDDVGNDLLIIDVSNPVSTSLIGSLNFGSSDAAVVKVNGNYAYVTDWVTDQLRIVDISNPTTPVEVGNLIIGGTPNGLVVQGDYTYIIDRSSDDLKVINISSPTAPTLTGSLSLGDTPSGIAIKNNNVYIIDQTDNDMKVISVQDPANPIQIGNRSLGPNPQAITISGNYAYVVDDDNNDLDVIDISDPTSPFIADDINVGDLPKDVGVKGNFAYVIDDGANVIRKITLSTPVTMNADITGEISQGTSPFLWSQNGNTTYTNKKVGIGTSTISSANSFIRLNVDGGHIAMREGFGIFSTNSSNTALAAGFDSDNEDCNIWAGGTPKMHVQADGKVGIGRVPVTNILEVEGNASKANTGDWLANSDARLKKNIQSLESKLMLEKLLSLQGITYEWNDTQTGTKRPLGIQYGFTAQNIQQVFPDLVTEDNHGFLQTAYGTYDAMQVEAIRALHDKIQRLKKERQELENNLEVLSNHILQDF